MESRRRDGRDIRPHLLVSVEGFKSYCMLILKLLHDSNYIGVLFSEEGVGVLRQELPVRRFVRKDTNWEETQRALKTARMRGICEKLRRSAKTQHKNLTRTSRLVILTVLN